MKKMLSLCLFLMLLCLAAPAAASEPYEWHYQMPVLEKYELSLTKHTYNIRIPMVESSGNYAGPSYRTVWVTGTWQAGKATEIATCYQSDQLIFRLVKTADCPQDPWLTDQPVYNNMQKKTEYLSPLGWAYEQAKWIMQSQDFYSAGLLSPTKAMLRTELAKAPPQIKSPVSGLSFPAMQPVKVTIQKHPDYALHINYEYRGPGEAAFTSAFPPDTKNNVSIGEIYSGDIYFFLVGEWRLHARANVPGAQYSEWLTLNITPRKLVLLNPLAGKTYQMKFNINGGMTAGVPLKIEHNHSENINVIIQYRPNAANAWTNADPSTVKHDYKRVSTFVTEGYLQISKPGEYRIQVTGNVDKVPSEWRQFTVAKLMVNPLIH